MNYVFDAFHEYLHKNIYLLFLNFLNVNAKLLRVGINKMQRNDNIRSRQVLYYYKLFAS